MEEEKLKWVKGYEGIYIITSYGRLYSMTRRDALCRVWDGGEIKVNVDGAGYRFVVLYRNGKGQNKKIHRLVAEAFIPNEENKPCIDHINGNKSDNRVCNLRWCTHKENMNNPITLSHCEEIVGKTIHLGKDNPFSRKVGQYNTNDDLIAEYNSVGEASRMTGISAHAIQKCAKGLQLSTAGYIWKYLSEAKCKMPEGKHEAFNKKRIAQYGKDGTLIATYESIAEAAKTVGCDTSNIGRAARGVTKSSKGFKWKFLEE